MGIDDRPPITVITHVMTNQDGRLCVRGTTADDGQVRRVVVNGVEARRVAPNFLVWEAVLDGGGLDLASVTAVGEDFAGNVEKRPHVVRVR
jgi:hypothetical protein